MTKVFRDMRVTTVACRVSSGRDVSFVEVRHNSPCVRLTPEQALGYAQEIIRAAEAAAESEIR